MRSTDELLALMGWQRPAWHADAACREHPEVNFFPERGEATAPAAEICASCLVSTECLTAGLSGHEVGVWGGTSHRQRKRRAVVVTAAVEGLSAAS